MLPGSGFAFGDWLPKRFLWAEGLSGAEGLLVAEGSFSGKWGLIAEWFAFAEWFWSAVAKCFSFTEWFAARTFAARERLAVLLKLLKCTSRSFVFSFGLMSGALSIFCPLLF